MKALTSQILSLRHRHAGRQNTQRVLRFLFILLALITAYSVIFHFLMAREGHNYSWVTGFYWTLTVMSTLGFGDITFHSDLGRIFSMVVLFTGIVFLLVLLPFTFIEFFYAPWMEAQTTARAPRSVARDIRGHVVLTDHDAVTAALIHKLYQYHYPYVLLVADVAEALRLADEGLNVMVGALDDPDTYRRCGIERAALVAATATDPVNTNVAFTVRELAPDVPIVTTARSPASVDILGLAGSTRVLRLDEMMGEALAWRANGGDTIAHVIGHFDGLLIAEAAASGTPLVGKTLGEARLREIHGVTVVGIWERGHVVRAEADTRMGPSSVLIIAGSRAQIDAFDEHFCIYYAVGAPVVILGGGRIGRATARSLAAREIDYRIVEKEARLIHDPAKYVPGDAAEIEVLQAAGLEKSPTVVITTNDDGTNTYLTIYCRRLRPDIQIISRSNHDRNVSTLHRAGADFVISSASMGANAIFNLLQRSDVVMVAEGLSLFRLAVPPALAGRTIAESRIRQRTGCSIVGLSSNGTMQLNPTPDVTLSSAAEMILIGEIDEEDRFLREFAT